MVYIVRRSRNVPQSFSGFSATSDMVCALRWCRTAPEPEPEPVQLK